MVFEQMLDEMAAGEPGRAGDERDRHRLVFRPRDSRRESRSAAPVWPGAKSELIGHK
jgi:hypothetical protein